jgi:HAD superfamily hydrolase (TIGR01509 family)
MAMDEKGLARRLQQVRRDNGLTQQELCQKSGLSYSTLAKIERGAIKSPSIFTIQSVASAMGIGLDELLGIAPRRPNQKKTAKNGAQMVFFDVNGCVVQFTHNAFAKMSQESGKPVSDIQNVFWEYDDAINRNEKSVEDINRALSELLHQDVDWLDYYLQTTEIIGGMHDLMTWVSEHYHIGLLTNSMPGFVAALQATGKIPDLPFKAIIDSSDIGSMKPENAMYEAAETATGFAGSQIMFVDDLRANLIAAKRFSWNTIWFDPYRPDVSIATIRQSLEPAS